MTIRWGETGDAAALLEAFHRLDLDDRAWLDVVSRAFAPLVAGPGGVIAARYYWEPGQVGFVPRAMVSQDPRAAVRAVETADQADELFLSSTLGANRRVYTMREALGAGILDMPIGQLFREFGLADMFGIQTVSHGVAHEGAFFGVLCPVAVQLGSSGRETFDRLAAHLAAAMRLRADAAEAHPVEGVLRPDGRLEHAEGLARGKEEREALARAVKAIDRARRREARSDPQVLLEAWRAIVEGRWSLLDVVESDGRRHMLARVNPPVSMEHASLTLREKQVAALLVQGVPQKAVAYELGMSPSTVAFHVKNIARKVGASGSTELVRVLAERRSSAG